MAEGILLCIAEQVLKNLASAALDEVALAWGFKDRLEKLKKTINTIKYVQLDAEKRPADGHAIHSWLERLATAVYEADDLFDEVATVVSRKQLMGRNKVIKEVHTFFSSSNQVAFAFSISRKIKAIREKLDDIVKDNTEFVAFLSQPRWEGSVISTLRGRDQTVSYVDSSEVIGREGDKIAILDMLASNEPENDEVLHVVPIVGIGGQGKTTLAQLVYNDSWVEKNFELRLWVCVSEVFDIKEITDKILKSATKAETPKLEMDQLRALLQNAVGDKRYFLVLDDVWNDNREEWLKLEALLKIGKKGSKIIVTTRSREVANIMGSVPLYELQGLLEDQSWELFQKMAFKPGQHHENPHLMMEVGKEIVKKCANVPLAIRAVGSLLYGKDRGKWLSLKNKSLRNIIASQNGIMDILKLSYQHLPAPLKNCFAYCALFPKDYEFDKETLIDLWMAEGFIIPINDESQSLEELADDYFLFLLQRCFFQDIIHDEWGDIKSCKMHDFMHDLAQQVAGVKCQVVKSDGSYSNKGIHHLSFAYRLNSLWKIPSWMLDLKLLRTFLLPQQMNDGSPFSILTCQELIMSFRCLRVLDLHEIEVKSLPRSIGKLVHLRYLNLSKSPITALPDSITELQNLQTLKIFKCTGLKSLPVNLRKLNNLRSLDLDKCFNLIYMPPGLGELTSLIKLPIFKVNNIDSPKIKDKPCSATLSDLKTLNNLRGDLRIEVVGDLENPLLEAADTNLIGKHGLTGLDITIGSELHDDVNDTYHDDALLEGLKPHLNLKKLRIYGYRGQKLVSWVLNNLCISLPNLVEVKLMYCKRCQQLPSFGKLPFLKRLHLVHLESVEYMEMDSLSLSSDFSSTEESSFQSLEELELKNMDNLEGWWKIRENVNDSTEAASHQLREQRLLSMSKLSTLDIQECPKLILFPLCPNLVELKLANVNKAITVSKMAASTSTSGHGSKLKRLTINNVEDLINLPRECLHQLSELRVERDRNLVSLDRIEMNEVFISLSSSLRSLEFSCCYSLRSLGRALEHLTALEKLKFWGCEQLDLSQNEQLPWKNFKNLRHLALNIFPTLVSLPSGFQHLTSLHSLTLSCSELNELPEWISCFCSLRNLELSYCRKLKSLPDGFHKLTSLNKLEIVSCPELTERCQAPNGADWPKIQHIPFVSIQNNFSY